MVKWFWQKYNGDSAEESYSANGAEMFGIHMQNMISDPYLPRVQKWTQNGL